MKYEIKELNLIKLYKENNLDIITDFYDLEYKLSMTMVDRILNLDKSDYIERSYFRYSMDPIFRNSIDELYIDAPLDPKVALGRYYDEYRRNQKKKNKENIYKEKRIKKLENLKKGIVEDNNELITGYFIDNKIIGFISTSSDNNIINIDKLYADQKNMKIGTTLINHVIKKNKDIYLNVMINNPARKLYEDLGFTYMKDNNDNNLIVDNNYKMKYTQKNLGSKKI